MKVSITENPGRAILSRVCSALAILVWSSPGAVYARHFPAPLICQTQPEAPEVARAIMDARDMIKSGHPQNAVPMLQNVVRRYPQSALLHLTLGNALSDIHDWQAALGEYQASLNLRSPNPDAVLNIAYCLCNSGKPADSISWFEEYLKESPQAPNRNTVESQMLIAKAGQFSSLKRYFDAKQALQQAINLSPEMPNAHFRLARALDELGDARGAIAEYEEVMRLEPKNSAAVFNIAGCYQSMGEPHEAITWFQRYLKNNPDAQDKSTVLNMIDKLKKAGNQRPEDIEAPDFLNSVREDGKFYRWAPQSMPIKVFISGGAGVQGYRDDFGKALFEALSAWSQASQNRIAFTLVGSPNQANIDCEWTGNPYDVMQTGSDVEQGVCLTQARSRKGADSGFIEHITLRILTVDRESMKPLNQDDMKKTCLHELGHALGLRGHSQNNHDIMFFSVSPTVWPVLSKRDKTTLLRLYEGYSSLGGS
ncbi:MAG TPA: tetratricopeptide repeat protein [Chroococcales cyanobacterium]